MRPDGLLNLVAASMILGSDPTARVPLEWAQLTEKALEIALGLAYLRYREL